MWFLFVSTDTAVWLTSVLTSQLATLPLAWLPGTTPALTGLSPFGTLNFMSYIHHSRHTQHLYAMPFGTLRIAKPLATK
jgi:hypothetical protein